MKLREDFRTILAAAIGAVEPRAAVMRHLSLSGGTLTLNTPAAPVRYDLAAFDRIFVVGAGKATAPMARAVEQILGDRITGGIISVKDGHTDTLEKVVQLEASHPVPDERGMDAARRMLELLEGCGPRDLVIALISGGGSALLPLPAEGITLEEKRATTDLLLKCGAPIGDINTVRKHLSRVKGGRLAAAASPATVICLMISDVVGDDPGTIASGPFSPDATTFADALAMLDSWRITEKIPRAVIAHVKRGADETPKPGDPLFGGIHHAIIASNALALQAAKEKAVSLGYTTIILDEFSEGDVADIARRHARIAREIVRAGDPVLPPACVLSGGECTVMVHGDGLGGRNTEFALHAAADIEGLPGMLVGSAGTDGTDGPTDAAGSYADGNTVTRARRDGLEASDFMARNDSYHFFEILGDLVKTGPTRTNVMDVRIILAG